MPRSQVFCSLVKSNTVHFTLIYSNENYGIDGAKYKIDEANHQIDGENHVK